MKTNKGFAHLFLIIFVVVAAAGAIGFLAYQNAQLKSKTTEKATVPENTNQQISPTTTQVSLTPTVDPIKDWIIKSYSTYQLKYPAELTINEREGSIFNLSKWGPTQTEGTELFDGFSVTFQPKELPNTSPKDYTNSQIEEVKEAGLGEIIEGPTPLTLNNYKGFTYIEEGLGKFTQIILGSDDGIMLMHISILVADPGNNGFQETVDQILSTFKFVN